MAEQIPQNNELWDAIKFHPFFQGVEADMAFSLIEACHYRFYEKNEMMFRKNNAREGLSLLLEGAAEVFVCNEMNDRAEVLEIVKKGEMIGFSSLADFLGVRKALKTEATVEVRALEPLKSLFIPFEVIARRWDDAYVRDYLLTQVSIRLHDVYGSLAEQVRLARNYGERDAFIIRVQDVMTEKIVAVTPDTSIMAAAQKMNDKKTSSVLILDEGALKGIITERDMVARVVAKGIPLSKSSREIMTNKPVTISRFAYYYDAISLIFQKGIKHLPVVEGTQAIGMVTLSDLLRKKNENVAKIIRRMKEADAHSLKQVKEAISRIRDTLSAENVPVLKVFDIITMLYDRLVRRAIELALDRLKEQGYERPGPFSFYQMGSAGRGEQFMLTDQDHFLVYDCNQHEYFKLLGREIVAHLELAGYERCKGLMMCSEKEWRGSLQDWENRLRSWMVRSSNENLMYAQNFFSYRFVYGSEELNARFEENIKNLLARSKIFLYRLAQLEREGQVPVLDKPVRALFKLERKSIDLKKQALFPYHHSLQILSLLYENPSGTPIEKIDELTKKEVVSADFSRDLKEAVSQILTLYVKHRLQQEKKNEVSSTIIHFSRLSTREKEELRLSLKTLKELQAMVFVRFAM